MLTTSARSNATPDELWAIVSGVTAWPDVLPTFASVAPVDGAGATAEMGSRFAVTQPGLRAAVYEVTACVPGSSFTWESSGPGITTTASHTVSADREGSRVDLTLDWHGPLAPLVRLLMGRRTQRMIDLEATTFADVAATRE